MIYFMKSHTNSVLSNSKWFLKSVISVSSNEILKQELGISEVTGIIVEWLSVASDKSLLKIGWVPDPSLHFVALEHMFSLSNKLICSHLNILVKQVTSEHLFSVLVVDELRVEESITENCFIDEGHILIVEEKVVVIQEQEGCDWKVHQMLFEQWIINV